jgi:anthranilate synthase component I
MTIVRRELPGVRDLLPLAAAFPARYPCVLESVARGGGRARFDILAAFPEGALTLHSDGRVRDAYGTDRGDSFLSALDLDWRAAKSIAPDIDRELPFRGGWVLFLGYELAHEIEPKLGPLPQSLDTPVALALRCPAAIIVDHARERTWLVVEAGQEELLDSLERDALAAHARIPALTDVEQIDEDPAEAFIAGVARIHDHLRAGDAFQVNLSRQWKAQFASPPTASSLYASLRHANPAPFAGLLQWQDWAIASSSPERLLEIRGAIAQTRPIAGTRPRFAGDDDEARTRELVGHVKERAEHVMLIDLERNDLGRICVPGSVRVDELMAVESYAHVHHIVSNVRGRLRDGVTPAQAIRAVFPGGTITGAPKVRTMQIIAEIERCARGAYTGSLGYLNRDGDMDLNILIRTFELRGTGVRFRAGAGIVVDSIAARELDETRAKARGLLRALGVDA